MTIDDDPLPHYGPTWSMMRDIMDSPRALQALAIRLACHLTEQPKMRSGVEVAAAKLKTDSFRIEECVTHNPRMFRLENGARSIALTCEGDNPATETPTQAKKRLADERKAVSDQSKLLVKIAEEERDTPYNQLWRRIERIGLDKTGAQGLAKRLISTYPPNYIEIGLSAAERAAPSNIPAYVIGAIKAAIDRVPATAPVKFTPARAPRTGRTTTRIGWESVLRNGVRHILYRAPEGTVTRVAPKPNEHIPSFTDDPGYEIR